MRPRSLGHVSLPSSKDDQKKSIFQRSERGGLRLKENVQFHLYISTSPCGDARIFSPHEPILEGRPPGHLGCQVALRTPGESRPPWAPGVSGGTVNPPGG